MIWDIGTKVLLLLGVFAFLVCPSFSYEEFDYNKYRAKTSLQNEFADYMQGVKEKIQRNWIANSSMLEGRSTVIFRINRFGEIDSTNIKISSGNKFFDENSIETIYKSAPFEKFPINSDRDFITIQYNFEASIVNTETMEKYLEQADYYMSINDKQTAKNYIDLAIKEIEGDSASYFLYARRAKLKKALGDVQGAEDDIEKFKQLKPLYDQKRVQVCKAVVETNPTPFAYFSLANAYDIVGDYENAIKNINKAIEMTPLNHSYIRYRAEMVIRHDKS